MHLKDELQKRGFLYQFTDEKLFDLYEKGGQSLYFGMDPTADSLHIGHLINFMAALQYMKRGNKLILIVGGATGMIGDPGGIDSERSFLDEKTLAHNVQAITKQVIGLMAHLKTLTGQDFQVEVMNNVDFYTDISYVQFLRDVGKHITINQMMNKETVKNRITDPDKTISYTEFSYMLMQGYDFLKLFQNKGVKLQISGSDQRGNVVTGIELIRKIGGEEAYGATAPLVLDSTGKKFGKSEGNAVRLDPAKNSPYVVYQYFLNSTDEDVEKYLKFFTLLDFDQIENIVTEHKKRPEMRVGQKKLAENVIITLFGADAARQAELVSDLLFGNEDVKIILGKLDSKDVDLIAEEIGSVIISDLSILDCLVQSGLVSSKSEAKTMVQGGGISINGVTVSDIQAQLGEDDFVNGRVALVRKGKKNYKLIIKN